MRIPTTRDIRLFGLINQTYTHSLLDRFFPVVTLLGLGGVQLPLVAMVWWFHRNQALGGSLAAAAILAFLLATAVVHLIKRRVKRLRPVAYTEVRFLVPVTRHNSFPSGHTATTFALAAVVAWYFPAWAIPLFLLAAVVGYSRVYVGVHFLSDVVVAAVIGLISAAAVLLRFVLG